MLLLNELVIINMLSNNSYDKLVNYTIHCQCLVIDPFNPHSHPMRWEPLLTLFYQMRRLEQGEMEKFVGSPTVRELP